MYQEIYIKEHGYAEECPKFTKDGKHDCARCVREFKEAQGKVAIPCPTYPLYSDSVTKVLSYADLFAVNAGEKFERDERARAVRLEKEYEASQVAKTEEQKSDEKVEPTKESCDVTDGEKQDSSGNESSDTGTSRNTLDAGTGTSAHEKQSSAVEAG